MPWKNSGVPQFSLSYAAIARPWSFRPPTSSFWRSKACLVLRYCVGVQRRVGPSKRRPVPPAERNTQTNEDEIGAVNTRLGPTRGEDPSGERIQLQSRWI